MNQEEINKAVGQSKWMQEHYRHADDLMFFSKAILALSEENESLALKMHAVNDFYKVGFERQSQALKEAEEICRGYVDDVEGHRIEQDGSIRNWLSKYGSKK